MNNQITVTLVLVMIVPVVAVGAIASGIVTPPAEVDTVSQETTLTPTPQEGVDAMAETPTPSDSQGSSETLRETATSRVLSDPHSNWRHSLPDGFASNTTVTETPSENESQILSDPHSHWNTTRNWSG